MVKSHVRVTDRNGRRLAILPAYGKTPQAHERAIGFAKEHAFALFGRDIYTFVHDDEGPGIGGISHQTHSNPLAYNNRRHNPHGRS